jgi:hypothetical protein
MKTTIFNLILVQIIISINIYGQTKPFRLLILIPDTAFTDSSLDNLRSGYERGYKFQYREEIRKEFKSRESDTVAAELNIKKRDSLFVNISNMKYYNPFAYKAAELFYFFLENKFPHLKVELSKVKIQNVKEFAKLAANNKSDYIVSYKDIKGLRDKDDNPVLKLKVFFYSTTKNKVVLSKDISGGAINKGDWSHCDGEFECIINNAISGSSEAIANYLFSTIATK